MNAVITALAAHPGPTVPANDKVATNAKIPTGMMNIE
jgi:hypothetical protein